MSTFVLSKGCWMPGINSSNQRNHSGARLHCLHRSIRVSCFKDGAGFDVSGATITPHYRSVPRDTDRNRTKVKLLFLGESNVCRSVLAEAFMNDALTAAGLKGCVDCESKGTRDYQVGEGPDKLAIATAKLLNLNLADNFKARFFCAEQDISSFDLLLVMDKYTAADVLREVAGYDLIDKEANFSSKVRLLGEFHPQLALRIEPDAQDIDDPLYGNMGGQQEQDAVLQAATLLEEACLGLLQFLQEQKAAATDANLAFPQHLQNTVKTLDRIDWLVPPMLQGRTNPPVPFV